MKNFYLQRKNTMKKLINIVLVGMLLQVSFSCDNFIDVVPDNVSTIDNAFQLRTEAEKVLFTCYSYLPSNGNIRNNVGLIAGDELWVPSGVRRWGGWSGRQIARGNQNVVDPYENFWEGRNGGNDFYEAIRQCNVLIDKIDTVPDISEFEKNRWKAEAKFLKAYYHFYLIRMYGPIVLVKENLPVSAHSNTVNTPRAHVDSSFSYVVELMDKAINAPELPDRNDRPTELGRIDKAIAHAIKAKVLVTAASPLFNGNSNYAGYVDPEGNKLFSSEFDPAKWDSAAAAAKRAIEFAESVGFHLYEFNPQIFQYDLTDTTKHKMNIRNSLAYADGQNPEVIWASYESLANRVQRFATPVGLDPQYRFGPIGRLAPPIHIAEMFYSKHGVPIEEDKSWTYNERFELKEVGQQHKYNLREGRTTVKLHFDREPRFYASLGFDSGIWYGQGRLDDSDPDQLLFIAGKDGEAVSAQNPNRYSVSGYFPKKMVNYRNIIGNNPNYSVEPYAWPGMRLADLYLLYAEAKNEADGPGPEVYQYLNKIRERAGLETVQDSWTNWSVSPDKYKSKEGLRDIIHRERMNELVFEGKRFWDIRRWKKASSLLNQSTNGWTLEQSEVDGYYRKRIIFNQEFTSKDYLFPLSENVLQSNTSISQNPGW